MGGRPRINQLLQSWPSRIDAQERTRRLIDLFVVSVLLDAGAGTKWSYRSKESGKVYSRSEGLAVASLEMFKSGLFSSDPTEPCQVDGAGLQRVTVEKLAKGMQHSDQNSLAGIEGRAGLLVRLADALNNQDFFGVDARPGNMLGESIHQRVGLSWSISFFLSKANHNILLFQTICLVILQLSPLLYPLSQSPLCGLSSWMVSLQFGLLLVPRSMAYQLATPGNAPICQNPHLHKRGKASFHSTSSLNGCATPSWSPCLN